MIFLLLNLEKNASSMCVFCYSGKVQSKSAVLKSCCSCVLEALKDFCNQRSSKYLMDIHLVNNSEEVTQLMVDTFKEAERCSSKPDRHDL